MKTSGDQPYVLSEDVLCSDNSSFRDFFTLKAWPNHVIFRDVYHVHATWLYDAWLLDSFILWSFFTYVMINQ